MKLIFATNNEHKIQEVRSLLHDAFTLVTLKEAGIEQDIPEPHDTLQANALEKATVVFNLCGENCFSEDSGLEVDALGGAPGVYSARYAGVNATAAQHINKLLAALTQEQNRAAQFRTVIALIENGQPVFFEGICKGYIAKTISGHRGFGYDPIFIPDGADRCFAEMELAEKNKYSHRRKAFDQLKTYLLSR